MSDKEACLRTTIHYYCFNGFHRSMQNAALEGIRIYPGDERFRFYYGVSLALEGRLQESIREIEPLIDVREISLGSILALIYAHNKCKVVEKEEVTILEAKLRDARKHSREVGFYFGALFFMFTKQLDQAKDYVDRMVKLNPGFSEGLILRGWYKLMAETEDKQPTPLSTFFEEGVRSDDPEAILGKAKYFEKSAAYLQGIETLNQAIVSYPQFIPAFIEKMKLLVPLKDWDQVVDCATRTLNLDRHCIEAKRYLILHDLAWTGNQEEGSSKLRDLLASMELREPKNSTLFAETGRLFSRLGNGNMDVLSASMTFVERAAFLDESNLEFNCELGYQCLLLGKTTDAQRHFKNATKSNESNIMALVGYLYCRLLEEDDTVLEQLEALEEFHRNATDMTPLLMYIFAVCSHRQHKGSKTVFFYLDQMVQLQLELLRKYRLGIPYYINLECDLAVKVVKLYLDYGPTDPLKQGQPLPVCLIQAKELLQPVVSSCPSLKDPLYYMSKINYLSGDCEAALCLLQRCLDQSPSFAVGHLLKAKILSSQRNFKAASQALETAMSYDFQVREHLDYIMVKVAILKEEEKFEEALKCLKSVQTSLKKNKSTMNANDKISFTLQMVDICSLLDQSNEASKLLHDLLSEYKGTPEEGRIIVGNATLAEAKGDLDEALSLLRSIGSDNEEHFIKSREKMANIYLKYRKDRRMYASCYREILDKVQQISSYLMLGDAYMNILEPEKAIEIYEQALKKNPKNGALIRKVGQALVKSHLFEKAVTYYKAAIKTSGKSEFRYDLSYLLFRMKRFKEAQDVIQTAMEIVKNQNQDLSNLEWEAKFTHLLAEVQLQTEPKNVSIQTLQKAQAIQARVMRRIPVERPDSLIEQRETAIEICLQLADQYLNHFKDFKEASNAYKEALNYDQNNVAVLKSLANLEMMAGNFEDAQRHCSMILKLDPHSDGSLLMMADLMFRKIEFEASIQHYQQLLDRRPDFYLALRKLIDACRRIGKLEQIVPYLEKAEKSGPRAKQDPGYLFSKGLYLWYTGQVNSALLDLNKARTDSELKTTATVLMIEICVNPDNETIGGEALGSQDVALNSAERQANRDNSITMAYSLLKEIQKDLPEFDHTLLHAFILLGRRTKPDADSALSELSRILSEETFKDNVGVIVGVATAHMILKQTPKARNQLKRLVKANWNLEEAEYLEKGWLLLSDIYIQSAKYDIATELLRRVLHYNKSCIKAYEYLGTIMEKESSYKDAAFNYEMAWKLTNGNNSALGFKLAFNYMKAKRYVDAIDVGKVVLDKTPDYPRIRKEIIEKCRLCLKC